MSTQIVRAATPRKIPDKHSSTLRLEPFVAIASDALRAAAGRVSARWCNEATAMLSSQDVTFELLELTRAVERGERSLANEIDSATLVLRRRLLEELRTETLREWTTTRPPSAQQMLHILNGFEFAQSLLEPDSQDGIAKRLSDPGSLGLVVEVAHDLRSPLTSILFLSEALLRGNSGPINDLQRRQIGIVYSAALGLINVASDVVEMARGTDDVDSTEAVPLSLSALMDPVRDVVLPMAEEKGVDVRITSAEPDQRFGLPVALGRVLLNLTTNALKFTDNGFIEISARALDARRVEFSVRDTGCGIEPEALRTLFHPFRRRSGPRSGYYFSGTGLGLTICRRLVQAMGGELKVETSRGLGTRFNFELEMPSCP